MSATRRATRLAAHGLGVTLPPGWDGEIYQRDLGDDPTAPVAVVRPVLHATNFPLPAGRGDFGSVAVEMMSRGAILLSVLEYGEASAGTPLFDNPFPAGLTAREFDPDQLQRPLPGQAGAQRFVTAQGRAFCIYAVLGSFARRKVLVTELNKVLATVEVDPL